jgi:hypothetical protein
VFTVVVHYDFSGALASRVVSHVELEGPASVVALVARTALLEGGVKTSALRRRASTAVLAAVIVAKNEEGGGGWEEVRVLGLGQFASVSPARRDGRAGQTSVFWFDIGMSCVVLPRVVILPHISP